jgi:hypothetical protein
VDVIVDDHLLLQILLNEEPLSFRVSPQRTRILNFSTRRHGTRPYGSLAVDNLFSALTEGSDFLLASS